MHFTLLRVNKAFWETNIIISQFLLSIGEQHALLILYMLQYDTAH